MESAAENWRKKNWKDAGSGGVCEGAGKMYREEIRGTGIGEKNELGRWCEESSALCAGGAAEEDGYY